MIKEEVVQYLRDDVQQMINTHNWLAPMQAPQECEARKKAQEKLDLILGKALEGMAPDHHPV